MNPFGPILQFELVRAARRQRVILSRFLYVLIVAGIAAATYAAATKGWSVRTRPQELARITEGLFCGLFALQLVLAVMFTVNWTADAFTAEKERRTLPFLLATPLTDREIVIDKLVSRLARVGLLLLAGLPVLFALQFFGGVEPLAAVVGTAILAATVLSLGSLCLLCSIYARTAKTAQQKAARVVAFYVVGLYLLDKLLAVFPQAAAWPGTAVAVEDVVDLFAAGNPLALGRRLTEAIRGRSFDDAGPAVVHYVLFHLIATGAFVTWAVIRLRPVSAAHAEGPPPPQRTGLFRTPYRPPPGDWPVLWKALYFDFRQYRTAGGRGFSQAVFALSFVPVIVTLGVVAYFGNWRDLPETMNFLFVRGLGTLVLCGLLTIIASQTSACIALERRRQTLDDLLLTDLSTDEILAQKWWASIAIVRPALVWVGVHWVVAVVAGGLHPFAVPVLVLEWLAYAAFAASLGLYWAVRTPTARVAGAWTGLIGFAAAAGPIVVGTLVAVATDGRGGWFALPLGASPLFALGVSGFGWKEFAVALRQLDVYLPGAIGVLAGTAAYALVALQLWLGACRRFPRSVGRG